MGKTYVGETVKLICTFVNADGEETPPDANSVRVTIYDPDGNAVVENVEPTAKLAGTVSTYYYNFDIPENAKPGRWMHVWSCTFAGIYKTQAPKYFRVYPKEPLAWRSPTGQVESS